MNRSKLRSGTRTRAVSEGCGNHGRPVVVDDLREAGNQAAPYLHSSHYLAFMIAYLIDGKCCPIATGT